MFMREEVVLCRYWEFQPFAVDIGYELCVFFFLWQCTLAINNKCGNKCEAHMHVDLTHGYLFFVPRKVHGSCHDRPREGVGEKQ